MAEPQKMVHLTSVQKRRKKFQHSLIDNVPEVMSAEMLEETLSTYFDAAEGSKLYIETGKKLMGNYFRLLRSVVARYLYYWPVSRRLLDEMISTGSEAIVKTIIKLKSERLDQKNNFKSVNHLMDNAIRHSIETIINDFRGVVPASERTNRDREARNQKPIYGTVDCGLAELNDNTKFINQSQDVSDCTNIDPFILELKDAIEEIAQTDLEKQVLTSENWGLSNPEIGEKIGKSARWVLEVRNRLRERYIKLGETL